MDPAEYLSGAPANLRLAIVGKDPFPSDATNIPFCKSDWKMQTERTCSGRILLEALGVDLSAARERFTNPAELFAELRGNGIVVLNSSYVYLGERPISRHDMNRLIAAHEINDGILARTETVLLCGQAKRVRWITPLPDALEVCHPSLQNSVHPSEAVRRAWHHTWAPGALRARYRL